MPQIHRNIIPRTPIKPIGSFSFLLALHIVFLAAYVLLVPAFEGADEPDHLRYIEAVFQGEKVHPIDKADPRRYGIEVYQPPLYYHLGALVARALPVVFPAHLAVNPDKNPKFPFLVHDDPGEIFPFDPPRRTLRFFRALSVLFGIAAFVILAQILRLLIPESPRVAGIILLVAALWPNNLQAFSLVSNDCLVYLLSLGLMLSVLNCINVDRPSWKHGLLMGTIFALGLLTKMTILSTAAVLAILLVLDSILDRDRGKAYLRILPAVILPIALLAGPFVISQITLYGSPTGETALKLLTPAWVRSSPRSFTATVAAMSRILPGSFLADLAWQQLTLPLISTQLFILWLFFNALMAVRTALHGFRRQRQEQILHRVFVLSSFFFMFLAIYRISVDWVGMQIRHVWNLWPITLLAPYFAVHDMSFLRKVRREGILNIISYGLMLILLPINFLVLYNHIIAYRPIERESRANLDYSMLINYWVQSPDMGAAYLDGAAWTDVEAYRISAKRQDWKTALFHASRAIQKGINDEESRLVYVRALRMLAKSQQALDFLHKGNDHSYEARLLEVDLLVDLGHFQEADQRVGQMLLDAPPTVCAQLKSVRNKIRSKTERN
jgi:hypothetical protein